jgi:hypothetical protein
MKRHNLKWFVNRIGKRIYRLTDICCCVYCKKVFEEGLIISNKKHATYLFDCQNEMNLEYADKKEAL